jgi:hypothetical protein
MADIGRVIQVDITRATRTASRRSFGTVLIAARHTVFGDRVREYEDPADMLTDGFSASHPAYLAAVALCSQSPRVERFKIGLRDGVPTQVVNVTPIATLTYGTRFELTVDGVTFWVYGDSNPTVAELTAAFVLRIGVDADAILASGGASSTSIQTITGDTFNGAGIDLDDTDATELPLPTPRNVTLTFSSHADWDATTAVVTGTDAAGRAISENFAIPNGGATTVTGAKVFATINSLVIPAQSGTGGTFTMGVGIIFDTNTTPHLKIGAVDHTSYFTITNTDAGAWYAYTAPSAQIQLEDVTAEPTPTLATDLGNIEAFDPNFFGLIVADAQSKAQIEKIAAWSETQEIVYAFHTFDTNVADGTDGDVLTALLQLGYLHTMGVYSRVNHGRFPDAAAFGTIFPLDIGSATFAFKALAGCIPDDLTSTQLTRIIGTPESPIDGLRGLVYTNVLPIGVRTGTAVTLGGLTAGGEWMDNIMGISFIKSLVQDRAFNVLLQSPKLPYTAKGIEAFAGAVRAALKACTRAPNPILDPDTLVVESTPITDVSESDRQARFYDGVSFDGRFSGAIHAAKIRGTVRA